MRLRTFQATDGDCLLLSSGDGRHMLVDGGRSTSFTRHAAESVSACGSLDVLCVSHIDADHITGVLTLFEHEVEWRVHLLEKQTAPKGRPRARKPSVPRPPRIKEVWHNGFGDQLGEGADDVRSMLSLAAASQMSLASPDDIPRQHYLGDLVLGEKQAIELSHRIAPDQLGIPLNAHFGGKLILAGSPHSTYSLGSTQLTVIGPFEEDVERLRVQWQDWLKGNGEVVETLRSEMDRDAGRMQLSEGELFLRAMTSIGSLSTKFGDRGSVTTPNLASIMLLAEENGKTILFTGDAAGQDIVKGLDQAGKLGRDGCARVDVLKVQHHGASANIDADFTKAVIADHYVFCGNGSHHNPELGAIDLIAAARFGDPAARSPHADAGRPFHLHFNNTPGTAGTAARRKHMEALEKRVQKLVAQSDGRMTARFHDTSFFDIDLQADGVL